PCSIVILFFHAPATTEIYTLSLHDALPICMQLNGNAADANTDFQEVAPAAYAGAVIAGSGGPKGEGIAGTPLWLQSGGTFLNGGDRKSTRLNSSHVSISYAVFCLKKKKESK